MITYKKLQLFAVAEFYFDEELVPAHADIVRHFWRSAPVSGTRSKPALTVVLDLTNSPQTLLANMHPETRYRIRRAEKDHFQYDFWSAGQPEPLTEFVGFFDRFASHKGLRPANRQRLEAVRQCGLLDLSCVRDSTGRVLVWHVHYRSTSRVRGMYSASLLGQTKDPSLRSLVGRANCFHTWRDILRFQEQGRSVYDLGGWYDGTQDQERLRINTFKEGFGGATVQEFNCETYATANGLIGLSSKSMWMNFLRWSRSWKPLGGPKHQTASPTH